jgi:hypothetical protein
MPSMINCHPGPPHPSRSGCPACRLCPTWAATGWH